MTFMKTFWAALLAVVVGFIIMCIVGFMFVASLASFMGDEAPVVESGSVLKIDLSNGISDSPSAFPVQFSLLGGVTVDKSNTLLQAIMALEKAAVDSNIKGIYIDLSGAGSLSAANLEELRQAIEGFKESGKFVVSYSDSYSQMGYYFSSVADAVLLNPAGDLSWRGISMSVMFYKGLIDKLGVDVEILRHGTFKSAVEPFMLTSMSPENRLQYTTLANTIWSTVLEDISRSRSIDTEILSGYTSDLTVRSAGHAMECGMVDALVYRDQADWLVKELVKGTSVTQALADMRALSLEESANDTKNQKYVSLPDYIAAGLSYGKKTSKNKIALIYADGDIVDGGDPDSDVVGTDIAARLARARKDEKTKAVVLRVNSPGGSALASELIWREMELTRQVKPVIVSMGGLAASGGYYISCPADIILADRMTLTGSIGVFGLMADISATLRDNLGVTVDVVKTNPSADLGSLYRSLTESEREAVMYSVEEVYSTFVGHVAAGRNMTYDEVDEIGQGRVWSGVNALENGLIDGYGGLKDALALAADRGGVAEDFRVWQVVDQADGIAMLMRQLVTARTGATQDGVGDLVERFRSVKQLMTETGVKAMLPYSIEIR
ncbi:MAG: signal peptide peptidase SppA [Rikenellaceae bacterium]|nr:signal peptide peptidase SppA [Rikenellaceae bacterium]